MPRIQVVTEDRRGAIVMSEHVVPDHLHDEHSAAQVLERLSWGVEDAVRTESQFGGGLQSSQSYLEVGD